MTVLPFPTSLRDFQRLFPSDNACANYLERVRWPEAFVCSCGWSGEPFRFSNRPGVLRCRSCAATKALRIARAAANSVENPMPDWATAAIAAGWKAPKGWKP